MPQSLQKSPEKIFYGGDTMVLSIQNPTKEEIEYALHLEENHPELLDDRELWILQHFREVVE
jgi:hypothetical protein